MQGESIIAACVAAAGGLLRGAGGLRVLHRIFGPQHDSEIALYYRDAMKSLMEENNDQRERIRELLAESERTHRRIEELEHALERVELGDLPAEFS